MRTWILRSFAVVSVLAGACSSAPPGRPMHEADGAPAREPVVQRAAPEPTVHTHPTAVRTAPKILSFWVPSHVSENRLVGGHTLDIEVEPARWWTDAVKSSERPTPQTAGKMREEHRTRPSKALWDSTMRGAFVPWHGAKEESP